MNYDTTTIKGLIEFLKTLNEEMEVNKLSITTTKGKYIIKEQGV